VVAQEALDRGDDRRGLLRGGDRGDELELGAAVGHRAASSHGVPDVPVLSRDAVLAAVDVAEATARVRDAFVRHRRGEWTMPAKVYLDSPPHGDFRAMPARGGDLAMLKWISSFPSNPRRGLPTVIGVLVVSDATTSEPLAILDAGAVTALRTGAVAAVAADALAAGGEPAVIGCGVNGAHAARALAAAGYGPGVCHDADEERAAALADELGWRVGTRAEALCADVVTCVTPGHEVVVDAGDLHPGLHLNMLGADGPGKAEATVGAVASCALFCDEWEQASHGGELTGVVRAGLVAREQVTDLGAVLTGEAPGRPGPEAVTLFDSTGLAIQDLAVAAAALEAWRDGRVDAPVVAL
jgi:ornithine cyclodeaminase/alanine dehydrogenase-like protein (mu-crystallin family)